MKKILSIVLAFSFVVPTYAAVAPAKPPKKRVITRVKEKLVSMKEAISRGRAVLKANWKCLTTGKGEKCNPDKRLSLQIISNFVKGNMKATKEGLRKLLVKHWECWKPILIALLGAGIVTLGVVLGGISGKGDFEPFQGAIAGGAAGLGTVALAGIAYHEYKETQPKNVVEMEGRLKKFGKCLVVMGLDVIVVVAIVLIIKKMVHQYETSESHIDIKKSSGKTFLIEAVEKGNLKEVAELIKKGANVNAIDKTGNTPLHHASVLGHKEIAELLIKVGAEVDKKDETGNTPLHHAAFNNHKEIVELLIKAGASVKEKNKVGRTPLRVATTRDVAELLITNGADVNAVDNAGDKILHFAANLGLKDIAELLIKRGAAVDVMDKSGRTPLHHAAMNDHREIAELLIKKGANVTIKNKAGNTPLDIAISKKYIRMVELLRGVAKKAESSKTVYGKIPIINVDAFIREKNITDEKHKGFLYGLSHDWVENKPSQVLQFRKKPTVLAEQYPPMVLEEAKKMMLKQYGKDSAEYKVLEAAIPWSRPSPAYREKAPHQK